MNEVKRKIHYFCKDTVQKGYAGQKITAAVLDTGESVIILSGDAKELMENGVGLLSIQKNVENKDLP